MSSNAIPPANHPSSSVRVEEQRQNWHRDRQRRQGRLVHRRSIFPTRKHCRPKAVLDKKGLLTGYCLTGMRTAFHKRGRPLGWTGASLYAFVYCTIDVT